MKDALVTVIVTIYNTRNFLGKCLESISKQTYAELEILLIDDGSSDGSSELLDDYLLLEKRARLIRKKNAGIAAARNDGLLASKGDYFIYCDSDDYLPRDAIESLLLDAKSKKADITIGRYYVVNGSRNKLIPIPKEERPERLSALLLTGDVHGGLWNKLIKRDAAHGATFQKDLDFMEDLFFLYKLLQNPALRICHTEKPVYFYVQHENSITKQLSEKAIMAANEVVRLIESIPNNFPNDAPIKIMKALNAGLNIIHRGNNLNNEEKAEYRNILATADISIPKRLYYLIALHGFHFHIKAFRFIKNRK